MKLRRTILGVLFLRGEVTMSIEDILKDMPFDSIEEQIDWSISFLKNKEVKLKELIDFFTIINGNQTILYDVSNLDLESETVNIRFTLLYAEYKVRLYKDEDKVASYVVQNVEVF